MVEGYGADPDAAWFAEYLDRIAPRAAVCGAHGAML
jgi:hypothetical protein